MKVIDRIKKIFIFCCCVVVTITLCSCKLRQPKYPTAGQEIQKTLNSSIQTNRALSHAANHALHRSTNVKDSLLPPLTLNLPNSIQPQPRHFDVTAQDMPAKNFFLGLVSGTSDNMLVNPAITGNITMDLKNVTISQALDAVRDMYGYQYKKTSMGYEILPKKMTTQIFTINYLNINRTGNSQTQLVSTEITNSMVGNSNNASSAAVPTANNTSGASTTQGSSSTIVTKEQNDFWTSLSDTLKTLIGNQEGRWVVINPQASVVMVHAYPNELHMVDNYLQTIQKNLQREVIIEAKILEITLNDQYQAGVNWKILGATQNGSNGLSSAFAGNGQMFSLSLNKKPGTDFNSIINLLSQQGNIQVLSSPRISTINNQEAVIKVGNDQFFVTGYTSNITPTGSTNTTSQSVELNPFFSGITLDVTPQISAAGGVTLYIHPSISTVEDQTKTINLAGTGTGSVSSTLSLPLALSSIRESDNVVHAQNGQIVVIGGLMQNKTSEVVAGTPGLSKIPVAGALARNTKQLSDKTELVILLRPIVVKNTKTWVNDLQNTANNFQKVQRGFHVGGLSEDFGTEGEKSP